MARRPFVGPAGSLLNRGLKQAGIERETCIVTNCVNKKPPHDEWKLHKPEDVQEGLAALRALARREEPALLVAFGEQALHALIAGDPDAALYKITEARGYVFPSEFGPVLACTHPAFILRTWHPWWALFCLDLQKAKRVYEESTNGGWKGGVPAERASYSEHIVLTPPVWVRDVPPMYPMAIDIETNADLSIACIGWAVDKHMGNCAPFTEPFFPFFHGLLGSAAPKVFQNGQFDTTVLERHGFEVRNWQHDTMLLHHTLDPLLAGKITLGDNDSGSKQTHKSLRFLASIYTDEGWWKEYAFTDEMQRYTLCAKDARVTLECFEKMQERLIAFGANEASH